MPISYGARVTCGYCQMVRQLPFGERPWDYAELRAYMRGQGWVWTRSNEQYCPGCNTPRKRNTWAALALDRARRVNRREPEAADHGLR